MEGKTVKDIDSSEGITLFGAGGHSKVVADILLSAGHDVTGIVDDNPRVPSYKGIPIGKPMEKIYSNLIVTIGNCHVRRKIVNQVKAMRYPVALHSSAIVADDVKIGEGSVVAHGSVIQCGAVIGKHCIINTNSSIDHDVHVGDFVHVAPGATICGEAEIGSGTWVGAGSVVIQGIKIGKNCMIGAGSVVVSDIPDDVTAYGNPCRVVKSNKNK